MIRSFQHKGLKQFFNTGATRNIQSQHVKKLRLILGRLHASTKPQDMNLPGLRLHQLTGNRANIWSVSVSGNWRITFKFVGEHAEAVNYEDYH